MEEIYKTYWALDVYAMYNQYYFRELENEIIKKVDRGYTQGIHNEFIYNYDEEKNILWVSRYNRSSNMWVHDDMGKPEGVFVECGVTDVGDALTEYYEHGDYATTKLNSCCIQTLGIIAIFNFKHTNQTIILERSNEY